MKPQHEPKRPPARDTFHVWGYPNSRCYQIRSFYAEGCSVQEIALFLEVSGSEVSRSLRIKAGRDITQLGRT